MRLLTVDLSRQWEHRFQAHLPSAAGLELKMLYRKRVKLTISQST
jgi:hypothetical protein